jgi:hypothetical protein
VSERGSERSGISRRGDGRSGEYSPSVCATACQCAAVRIGSCCCRPTGAAPCIGSSHARRCNALSGRPTPRHIPPCPSRPLPSFLLLPLLPRKSPMHSLSQPALLALRSTSLCKRTPARTLIHTLADAQCTGTHAQRNTLNTGADLLCVGRHSGSRLTAANLRRALRPMVVRHNESAEFKHILGTCRSSP